MTDPSTSSSVTGADRQGLYLRTGRTLKLARCTRKLRRAHPPTLDPEGAGQRQLQTVGCARGDYLEGPVGIAHDAQKGLRVSGVSITDNGDLPRLRKGIG